MLIAYSSTDMSMMASKTAVVTAQIKKNSLPSDELKNYHPISGLSFTSKLVESLVAKQHLKQILIHDLDNS